MNLILTGGAGFIGANLAHALHARGFGLIIVDNFENGDKYRNLAGLPLIDCVDKRDFLPRFSQKYWGNIAAVVHQGACSSTVERNGRYMLDNNYHYSKELLLACQAQKLPFLYASSAAVYGLAEICIENDDLNPRQQPLNVYGYSKWLFDQHIRAQYLNGRRTAPIIGLRYFNVYGPREAHKGRMASVAWHLSQQWHKKEPMRLFDGWDGYGAGEQKRDFIFVDDVVAVNMFFLDEALQARDKSGIYNCGSGVARAFNDIPRALIQSAEKLSAPPNAAELIARQQLTYIPFPDDLKGRYQSFTQADLTALRAAGFTGECMDIFEGMRRYWPSLSSAG